ncbi:gamma-glutamylcyclotransferase family protein [Noviherbaspirillum massiliense]|uniref:gamma-glutamylcyclotransferase family protein n=1 Tax=Noviherbaspirillum massiliense TaxID=1465823 RepID=UPI00031650F2|nr:gamma-glutamylcyclotransferase family protein [Noviherbaspirillum massiliense]
MTIHVFTYGSLMFPEVWERVVRGRYRSAPASVAGHARYAVAGATYPGMVRNADDRVEGIVYFDVAPDDVAVLDAFEGSEYRRDMVEAVLASGASLSAGAFIYLLPGRLSALPWNPEAFQLHRFLQAYCPGA